MAGTTVTPAVLFGPTPIAAAAAALYTAPANTTVTINRVAFNNITTGAIGLSVWVVRSGGTNTNSNLMIGDSAAGLSIAAGPSEPYIANVLASLVLNAGDAIWAQASAATSLNGMGSGWTQ